MSFDLAPPKLKSWLRHCLWEQEFSVSYAKQSANSIAHSFAKYAKQIDYEIVWLEESPPHALEALYFDHCCFMNEWYLVGLLKKKKTHTLVFFFFNTVMLTFISTSLMLKSPHLEWQNISNPPSYHLTSLALAPKWGGGKDTTPIIQTSPCSLPEFFY